MSLIEEALRRVQDATLSKPSPTKTPPAAGKPQAKARPGAHPWSTAPPTPPVQRLQKRPAFRALVAVAAAVFLLTAALVAGGAYLLGRTLTTTQSPMDQLPRRA